MKQQTRLYAFLCLLWSQTLIYGQHNDFISSSDSLYDWQEQVLMLADPDVLTEDSYMQFVEMVSSMQETYQYYSSQRVSQQLMWRADRCLNKRSGYQDTSDAQRDKNKAYLGDPWHQTIRYRIQVGKKWEAGFVLDKDAGEAYVSHFPWSDSYSLFVSYKTNKGIVRKLIGGHYRLRLGSGLLINQQFSLGKRLFGSSFIKTNSTLSPHSSTDESNYLQGVATQLQLGRHWQLLPFFSVKQIDGKVEQDTLVNWKTDGYHRLNREAAQRNSSWLTTAGLRSAYSQRLFSIGVNVLYNRFNRPFWRPERTYNTHYFRGTELLQSSIDYHVMWMGVEFRGETAVDDNGGIATTGGFEYLINDRWRCSLLYRYYSNDYRQLWASSLAESSSMQGEKGILCSIEGEPFAHWRINAMFDYFRFSQPQYAIYAPSDGYELSLQALYSRSLYSLSLGYRMKHKAKNNSLTTDNPTDLTRYIRQYMDGTFTWQPLPSFRFRTQVRSRFYSAANTGGVSTGFAVGQSVGWTPDNLPLKTEWQTTWFNTDSYDARIYMTEKNILYGFGLPMLQGTGWRHTFTASFSYGKRLTLEGKWALTNYARQNTIGSDLQQIAGNMKHDLWLQCRIKF